MRRTRLSPWLLAAVAAAPLPARTQPTPGLPPASASQEARPPADGSPVFPERRKAGAAGQAPLPTLQFGNFRVGEGEAGTPCDLAALARMYDHVAVHAALVELREFRRRQEPCRAGSLLSA